MSLSGTLAINVQSIAEDVTEHRVSFQIIPWHSIREENALVLNCHLYGVRCLVRDLAATVPKFAEPRLGGVQKCKSREGRDDCGLGVKESGGAEAPNPSSHFNFNLARGSHCVVF